MGTHQFWGNLTVTSTHQNRESGIFNSFIIQDAFENRIGGGVGINLWGLASFEAWYTNDGNIGIGFDILGFGMGVSIGASGIGLSISGTWGGYTHSVNLDIGLGTIAIAAAVILVAPKLVPILPILAPALMIFSFPRLFRR